MFSRKKNYDKLRREIREAMMLQSYVHKSCWW